MRASGHLPISSAVLLLAVAGLVGCAQFNVPRIDPTGERLLVFPNELPPGTLGPPVASTGPTASASPGQAGSTLTMPLTVPSGEISPEIPSNVMATPVWPDPAAPTVFAENAAVAAVPGGPAGTNLPSLAITQSQDSIILSPQRLMAPVGSEVVLKAGICSDAGHLLTSQRIEWLIEDGSVGSVIAVGQGSLLRPWSPPRKVDNRFAIGRTSNSAIVLDRGTTDPRDDILLRRGESWVSLSSAVEGTSRVTAFAPGVDSWKLRRQTAVVHWIDAQWVFPNPAKVPVGSPSLLSTRLSKQSNGLPIAGWTVRYDIVSGDAGFSPDGAASVDVLTDGAGAANAEIFQKQPVGGSAAVQIQIIRPPLGAVGESLVLGSSTTSISWSAPAISIDVTAPSETTTGSNTTFNFRVTNTGDIAATNVVISAAVPAQLEFLQSSAQPESTGRSVRWSLGDLPAGATRMISCDFLTRTAGRAELCARARSAENLSAEACATVLIASGAANLELRLNGPDTASVGQQVQYQAVITNRGTATARGLVITDRFDQGFRHLDDPDSLGKIEGALEDLAPGGSQTVTITLQVERSGQICHEVEVRGEDGIRASARACLNSRGAVQPSQSPSPPKFNVRTEVRPTASVGDSFVFRVYVENIGQSPLEGIVLSATADRELKMVSGEAGHELDGDTILLRVPRVEVGREASMRVQYEAVQAGEPCIIGVAKIGQISREDQACIRVVPRSPPPGSVPLPRNGEPPPAANPGGSGANLDIRIYEPGDSLAVGDRAVYQLELINRGDESVNQVVLRLEFSPEVAPDVSGSQGPVAPTLRGNQLVFAPIVELRPGSQQRFAIPFNLIQPGTARFVVEAFVGDSQTPAARQQEATTLRRR